MVKTPFETSEQGKQVVFSLEKKECEVFESCERATEGRLRK